MPRVSILLPAALVLVLAACSSPAVSPSASAASPSAPAGGSPRVIAVTMSDAFAFEPASFSVATGETVRFEVTNGGAIRHEFFIGDEGAQTAHEADMMEMGGMLHDEANGIFVDPGQMKALEHTFESAGTVLIGCHEAGHYAAGMMATVTVTD